MVGRYGIIENGKVVNAAVADAEFAASQDWIALPHGVGPGWLWNGTAFSEPEPEPVPVPMAITPRQCRLVLLAQGLYADVESMIAQQDEAVQITWQYALEFRRDDPLLNALAANLGLTDEQIDQFFTAAAAM